MLSPSIFRGLSLSFFSPHTHPGTSYCDVLAGPSWVPRASTILLCAGEHASVRRSWISGGLTTVLPHETLSLPTVATSFTTRAWAFLWGTMGVEYCRCAMYGGHCPIRRTIDLPKASFRHQTRWKLEVILCWYEMPCELRWYCSRFYQSGRSHARRPSKQIGITKMAASHP